MKKILFAILGLLVLTTFTATYADDVQTWCNNTWANCVLNQQFRAEVDAAKSWHQAEVQALKDQVAANKALIAANRKNFNANFSGARSYLTKPLMGDTKLAVDTIISTKDAAMKALQTATNLLILSWTVDRSGYITQAEAIITAFRTSLLPYVDPAKLTAFDTFIQSKINSMIINVGIKQTNASLKMDIWTRKVTFKERLNQKKAEHKTIIQQTKPTK